MKQDISFHALLKNLKITFIIKRKWDKSRKKGRKEYIDANYMKLLDVYKGIQTKGKAQTEARNKYDQETENKKKGYLPFEFYAQFCKGGKVVGTDKIEL